MGFYDKSISDVHSHRPKNAYRGESSVVSGHRYYDAELGRWLNRDPIAERGGLNIYGFVNNEPVGDTDVLGQFTFEEHDARLAEFTHKGSPSTTGALNFVFEINYTATRADVLYKYKTVHVVAEVHIKTKWRSSNVKGLQYDEAKYKEWFRLQSTGQTTMSKGYFHGKRPDEHSFRPDKMRDLKDEYFKKCDYLIQQRSIVYYMASGFTPANTTETGKKTPKIFGVFPSGSYGKFGSYMKDQEWGGVTFSMITRVSAEQRWGLSYYFRKIKGKDNIDRVTLRKSIPLKEEYPNMKWK